MEDSAGPSSPTLQLPGYAEHEPAAEASFFPHMRHKSIPSTTTGRRGDRGSPEMPRLQAMTDSLGLLDGTVVNLQVLHFGFAVQILGAQPCSRHIYLYSLSHQRLLQSRQRFSRLA